MKIQILLLFIFNYHQHQTTIEFVTKNLDNLFYKQIQDFQSQFGIQKVKGKGSFGVVKVVKYKKGKNQKAVIKIQGNGIHLAQDFLNEVEIQRQLSDNSQFPDFYDYSFDLYYDFQKNQLQYNGIILMENLHLNMDVPENGRSTSFSEGQAHFFKKKPHFKDRLEQYIKLFKGIQYSHGKGYVIADIKPDNLMTDLEGNLKLIDFGLAGRLLDEEEQIVDNTPIGTIIYNSPQKLFIQYLWQKIPIDDLFISIKTIKTSMPFQREQNKKENDEEVDEKNDNKDNDIDSNSKISKSVNHQTSHDVYALAISILQIEGFISINDIDMIYNQSINITRQTNMIFDNPIQFSYSFQKLFQNLIDSHIKKDKRNPSVNQKQFIKKIIQLLDIDYKVRNNTQQIIDDFQNDYNEIIEEEEDIPSACKIPTVQVRKSFRRNITKLLIQLYFQNGIKKIFINSIKIWILNEGLLYEEEDYQKDNRLRN